MPNTKSDSSTSNRFQSLPKRCRSETTSDFPDALIPVASTVAFLATWGFIYLVFSLPELLGGLL